LRLIEMGKSSFPLRYKIGPALAQFEATPEAAIGYDEEFVNDLYKQCGLVIRKPIYYGWWCGRERFLSCQDQIVAFKN
jgi:hypothetical protein